MNINDNNSSDLYDKSDASIKLSDNVSSQNRRYVLIGILILIVFVLTNVVSYLFGMNFVFGSSGISSLSSSINDSRKVSLIKNILKEVYNGEVDENGLTDEAIKGMVSSLGDPYTVYMSEKEFEEFNVSSKGEYVGIGIQVAYRNNSIAVVSVFDDSPAYKSGIHPGDVIVSVGGEKVSDIDIAIDRIRGEEFTSIDITLLRKNEEINVSVIREKIIMIPVEYRNVDEKIGYIKINSFDENSSEGVREAVENLKSEGLIIDLRGNPGGLLNECIDIASEFLEEGLTILSTEDKYGTAEVFKAKRGNAEDTTIVVMADSSSASASEVLVGALRDNDRSIFVGEKTFGKGLVQSVFDIGDGSGLKVTVSKYYTPNGDYINEVGINPDIEVKYSQEEYIKNREIANGDVEVLSNLDPQYQKALEIIKEKVHGS